MLIAIRPERGKCLEQVSRDRPDCIRHGDQTGPPVWTFRRMIPFPGDRPVQLPYPASVEVGSIHIRLAVREEPGEHEETVLHQNQGKHQGTETWKTSKNKGKNPNGNKTAEDIISPKEMEKLFKYVPTTRNRAMIELLYESAGWAGEIATMTWGQVTFYPNYASIRLDGKTGKTRQAPLYSTHVVLRRWKDQYPGGDPGPDDLIFPARAGGIDPMSYTGMAKIVKIAAGRAGIEKPITLHTFRHSRITHLLQAGMNESTIKLLAWGDVGSNMLKVYSHLTLGDVEAAFNQIYGIKSVEEFRGMDPAVSPRQCSACGMLNPPGNSFCGGCGKPLTAEAVSEVETDEKYIEPQFSPDDLDMLIKLLEKMKAET